MGKKIAHRQSTEITLIRSKEKFEKELSERIEIGKKLHSRVITKTDQFDELQKDYTDWNDYNLELLKRAFSNSKNEYWYRYSQLSKLSGLVDYFKNIDTNSPAYKLKLEKEKIENCINYLERFVKKLPLIPSSIRNEEIQMKSQQNNNIGFIVHGHNDTLKFEVARFLENDLKKKAIILHEQANGGKTVIEKFEKYSNVDFAIALWTNDDLGKAKGKDTLNPRARQNVIFETGFFLGKIGRQNVIILHEKGIEIPSDYSGVVYIAVEGNWKDNLRKEIEEIYK